MTHTNKYEECLNSMTVDKDGYGVSFEYKHMTQTIREALKICAALEGEPSNAVIYAGQEKIEAPNTGVKVRVARALKAMIEQLKKEIE